VRQPAQTVAIMLPSLGFGSGKKGKKGGAGKPYRLFAGAAEVEAQEAGRVGAFHVRVVLANVEQPATYHRRRPTVRCEKELRPAQLLVALGRQVRPDQVPKLPHAKEPAVHRHDPTAVGAERYLSFATSGLDRLRPLGLGPPDFTAGLGVHANEKGVLWSVTIDAVEVAVVVDGGHEVGAEPLIGPELLESEP